MKSKHFYCILLTILVSVNVSAQDIYFFYKGVTENMGTEGHVNEVLISSLSGGMFSEYDSGIGSSGVKFEPYSFTKSFDASSILLMQKHAKGESGEDAEFRFYATSDSKVIKVLVIKLKNPFITSYSSAGTPCGGCPLLTENITMEFEAVKIIHGEESDPNNVFTWNLKTGKESF
tara:strand:+ start:116 stop:640 length:525 start_codon:yes stop_codon:yes gene_type:complete